MKKKLSQRITSAFLVVVMVLLMIPLNVINIWADSDSGYEVPTTGHKLLSTYNALSGEEISTGAIASLNTIFNSEKFADLLKSANYLDSFSQYGELHQGSDMESFAKSAGISISSSVGAEIGMEKIFKVSASAKFGTILKVEVKQAQSHSHYLKYKFKIHLFRFL